MKQHITKEQFDELSQDNKKKLFEALFHGIPTHPMSCIRGALYGPVDINNEYLNVGRMIEFLEERTRHIEYFSIRMGRAASDGFAFPRGTLITDMDGVGIEIEDEPELCDALWEAVKEVLNGK